MRISIFGLGYVGAVSAGCLAEDGHDVLGVDPNRTKVTLINAGQSPIVESGLPELIDRNAACARLRATDDPMEAVRTTEISLVCVGTPSQTNGNLNLSYVRAVCEQIGDALARKDEFHVVVIRSTMLPGSMRDVVIPILESRSGKKAGIDFGVCNNPEFLREGSAIHDYRNPPKTVVGESDPRAGDVLMQLYAGLPGAQIRTSIETAEMVKYADNTWHALKVTFANEIGAICRPLGIDSHHVMRIFCEDTKLNLSPYYLKPGFAFGGSCLPKDVRALNYKAKSLDVPLPVIASILESNDTHIDRAVQAITRDGRRRIGILGFAFKAGTDDLRESPIVEVIERLIGKGYELCLYDRNVSIAALTGANRDYILNHIPHISRLMCASMSEVLTFAETIVIGNPDPEFAAALTAASPSQRIVDLVRIGERSSGGNYEGICW